jgi:ParB family chromosome partitioning protein
LIRFSKEAAERTGLSERTIQRAAALYEELGPKVIEQLRRTPIAGNAAQLKAFAKIDDPKHRAACVKALESGVRTVREALSHAGVRRPNNELSAAELRMRKFTKLWSEMGAKERRAALAFCGVAQDAIDGAVNPRGKAAK